MCNFNSKKRKRADSIRIWTFNTQGLADKNKRRRIDDLFDKAEVDLAFFQEGSASFHNPVDEAYDGLTTYNVPPTDETMSLLVGANVKPMGGKARRTPYNVRFDESKWELVPDSEAVDYSSNPTVRDWVREPLTQAERSGAIGIGGSSRRKALTGNPAAISTVRKSVQKRIDLLSHQRPKCIKSKDDTKRVFFFHSPLGGETTMKDVGLDRRGSTNFGAAAGFGSGGQVAPTVMSLFQRHLSGFDTANNRVNPLPDNVVVVGDTNVRDNGMDFIFEGANRGTSSDGLCHVVTAEDMKVISTDRSDIDTTIGSDHHWVFSDVRFSADK